MLYTNGLACTEQLNSKSYQNNIVLELATYYNALLYIEPMRHYVLNYKNIRY